MPSPACCQKALPSGQLAPGKKTIWTSITSGLSDAAASAGAGGPSDDAQMAKWTMRGLIGVGEWASRKDRHCSALACVGRRIESSPGWPNFFSQMAAS